MVISKLTHLSSDVNITADCVTEFIQKRNSFLFYICIRYKIAFKDLLSKTYLQKSHGASKQKLNFFVLYMVHRKERNIFMRQKRKTGLLKSKL